MVCRPGFTRGMSPSSLYIILLYFSVCIYAVRASHRHTVQATYKLKERHHVPPQWTRRESAPADHVIQLQIGLRQGRFDELKRHLYEVSNPRHERYGQHLSAAEVAALAQPRDDTLVQVIDWLQDNGIDPSQLQYSQAKDWIKVSLAIPSIERLLDTTYSIYQHVDGTKLIRTPQWSLPQHLHGHIDTIQPTNSFLRPNPKLATLRIVSSSGIDTVISKQVTNKKATATDACNVTAVTSQCLRTLYGTIDYVVQSAGKNRIGLTNYLTEVNNRSDISIYLQKFRPGAAAAAFNFTTEIIANGDNQQAPNNATQNKAGKGLEGNLDAETIIGMTVPTPLTTYNTGGSPPFIPDGATRTNTNEPYLDWVQYILNQTDIPQVISTSYGDDEQSVPLSFATSVCNSFAQLGARGVTLLFSSGDNGVGKVCFSNDGRNASMFLPAFPASCPYVTTVGATKSINPEVVAYDPANNFSSGGGFSNYFARPSYQDTVVQEYISNLGANFSGLYNTSGRGYPDISAQGFHFLTIWNGSLTTLDGTSASAPTAASIISLVNDALIAAGKPVLGFMNPWLYSQGYKAFTDVVDGTSMGCNTTGFPAREGWDPVTGFGTPNFPKIRAAVIGNGMSRLRFSKALLYTIATTCIISARVSF